LKWFDWLFLKSTKCQNGMKDSIGKIKFNYKEIGKTHSKKSEVINRDVWEINMPKCIDALISYLS
jgi:hypothetical protein